MTPRIAEGLAQTRSCDQCHYDNCVRITKFGLNKAFCVHCGLNYCLDCSDPILKLKEINSSVGTAVVMSCDKESDNPMVVLASAINGALYELYDEVRPFMLLVFKEGVGQLLTNMDQQSAQYAIDDLYKVLYANEEKAPNEVH